MVKIRGDTVVEINSDKIGLPWHLVIDAEINIFEVYHIHINWERQLDKYTICNGLPSPEYE